MYHETLYVLQAGVEYIKKQKRRIRVRDVKSCDASLRQRKKEHGEPAVMAGRIGENF
jgi:hypothetical protein